MSADLAGGDVKTKNGTHENAVSSLRLIGGDLMARFVNAGEGASFRAGVSGRQSMTYWSSEVCIRQL